MVSCSICETGETHTHTNVDTHTSRTHTHTSCTHAHTRTHTHALTHTHTHTHVSPACTQSQEHCIHRHILVSFCAFHKLLRASQKWPNSASHRCTAGDVVC